MKNCGFSHLPGAFEDEDGILRQPWPYPVNDISVNHVIILMDDHEKINDIFRQSVEIYPVCRYTVDILDEM